MRRPGLLALLISLGLGLVACDEDLLNPMSAKQPKVGNYGESEFYDDGLAMRDPPAGTVPRERIVGQPGIATGKAPGPAGAEVYLTSFPIKVDRALVELGQRRFTITCATCHGPVGDGDSIVARQMALRPPPSLHNYVDRPPGYIYDVITKGFGLMASYAAELTVQERWAVVAYVRALQISQASPLDRAPADERARLMSSPADSDQQEPRAPSTNPAINRPQGGAPP
jgi:mono/diheme cytochrome c family protein